MLAMLASLGCESKQSQQERADLAKFGEHYRRISEERFGDVDWLSLKEFESDFPDVASRIDKDLVVHWFEDVHENPTSHRNRVLAFSMFSTLNGGPVLFLDGSVRQVTSKELEQLRKESSARSKTGTVEMVEVDTRPYVETPIQGVSMPLPKGWRWDMDSNAYTWDESKSVVHLQILDADFESAMFAVGLSQQRRNAGGVRTFAIEDHQGVYQEFFLRNTDPEVPRVRVLTLLLPRGDQTLQITASLPTSSKHVGLFRQTLLGCRSE